MKGYRNNQTTLWGTAITYAGYFMLFCHDEHYVYQAFSFCRFKTKTRSDKDKKSKLITVFVLLLSFNGFAQTHNHESMMPLEVMKTMWKTETTRE
jgi:hypothetical protein